jgi:co-chaperonin GroES (HSP10)
MSSLNYKALNGAVLVEAIKEEKKTQAGLYLPETKRQSSLVKARVLIVDQEDKYIREGDIIFYRKGLGVDTEIDGQLGVLLKTNQIEFFGRNE